MRGETHEGNWLKVIERRQEEKEGRKTGRKEKKTLAKLGKNKTKPNTIKINRLQYNYRKPRGDLIWHYSYAAAMCVVCFNTGWH